MNAAALSDALLRFVRDQLERLEANHFPGWELPRVFAGHPVGPDVRADLAFVLSHLAEAGCEQVAGHPVDDSISQVLRPIDGPGTHSFFSYRVAETLARYGGFDENALLTHWSSDERENLAQACDSTAFIPLLERGQLPRNYAAVLARCERARERLGLLSDPSVLDDLLSRTQGLLANNPNGFLDDSNGDVGRYDIYSADLVLFTEPFCERLGAAWRHSADSALRLVEHIATRNGAAVCWGRSTGALSLCLTLELAALTLARNLSKDPARWLALASNAFEKFSDWMDEDGVINAHRGRNTYAYRGPARRLQMTLDALGKLAWAALGFRQVAEGLSPCPVGQRFPDRDVWIEFQSEPPSGVWCYRSRDLAFVLPAVGVTASDYLPAPQNPGLFEVPVDANLPSGVPWLVRHGVRYAAGGLPQRVVHAPGRLRLVYQGFPQSGLLEPIADAQPFAGQRDVQFVVDGRTLHATEKLRFAEPPEALALQFPEAQGRPLHVAFECSAPHRVDKVQTQGLAEYRSFWGELPWVHQLDIEPGREVELKWSVTPKLRITSTERDHHYHRSLYDPIQDAVHDVAFPRSAVANPSLASALLRDIDLFHLHWPEWLFGPDSGVHRRLIEALRAHQVRIVWTQHNMRPHRKEAGFEEVYALWAEAADAAIHHSEWGMALMREHFHYGAHTLHRVIPHGHFGNLMTELAAIDRAAVEAELGLQSGRLRIGVIGAPREEKKTQLLMDAFAACRRDDLELLVLSLGPEDQAPDDSRIHALPHQHLPRDEFNRRLACIDVLAIPIEGGDYLTTGQFADAVGLGIPALISGWPFLEEMLGDAGIVYGRGQQALLECLGQLDREQVARAARASRALQAPLDWRKLSRITLELLNEVGTAKL